MSKKEVAILSCRILAIYSVLSAARALNYLMILEQMFQSNTWPGSIILILISSAMPSVLLCVFGVVLWLKAEKIAACMLPVSGETVESPVLSIAEVQSAAFSVVGVMILAEVIPQLAQTASNIIIMHKLGYLPQNQWFLTNDISRMVGMAIQLILGFWLFFGSRGMAGLYRKIREAGLSRKN